MSPPDMIRPKERPLTVESEKDLTAIQATFAAVRDDAAAISDEITKSVTGLLTGTRSLEQTFKSIALSIAGSVYGSAMDGLSGTIKSGIEGIFGSLIPQGEPADGGVTKFAKGGILSRPTYFPDGDIMNLAGEAGPEAVLPLARGGDGRLGVVSSGGGGGVSVTMNVTTQDAQSFRKSEMQIASGLARAVQRGRRGL